MNTILKFSLSIDTKGQYYWINTFLVIYQELLIGNCVSALNLSRQLPIIKNTLTKAVNQRIISILDIIIITCSYIQFLNIIYLKTNIITSMYVNIVNKFIS